MNGLGEAQRRTKARSQVSFLRPWINPSLCPFCYLHTRHDTPVPIVLWPPTSPAPGLSEPSSSLVNTSYPSPISCLLPLIPILLHLPPESYWLLLTTQKALSLVCLSCPTWSGSPPALLGFTFTSFPASAGPPFSPPLSGATHCLGQLLSDVSCTLTNMSPLTFVLRESPTWLTPHLDSGPVHTGHGQRFGSEAGSVESCWSGQVWVVTLYV